MNIYKEMMDSQIWVKIEGEEFEKNLLDSNHMWKLRNWVKIDKLHRDFLYGNPRALHIVENHPQFMDWKRIQYCPNIHINHLLVKNPEEINWLLASRNPNGLHLALKNPEKIIWNEVSSNPRGIELLKRNPEKIVWYFLSMNSNAMELYEGNEDKLDMTYLSMNPNPEVIPILEKNLDKVAWHFIYYKYTSDKRWIDFMIRNIDKCNDEKKWKALSERREKEFIPIFEKNKEKINWSKISSNPNAYDFLMRNEDKICWYQFSVNSSDEAVEYLIKNPDKIKWDFFSSNRSIKAMEYISKNTDKIRWMEITNNPNIFELDREFIKKRMNIIREELIMRTWHPSRFEEWCFI